MVTNASEFLLSLVLRKPLIVITGALSKKNQEAAPPPPLFFETHRSFFMNSICWISSAS